MDDPMLHVYGQYCEHDDVQIVGNEVGLRALREAIDRALEKGTAEARDFFVGDGEGYDVTVAKRDVGWEEWGKYYLPYIAEHAKGQGIYLDPRRLPQRSSP